MELYIILWLYLSCMIGMVSCLGSMGAAKAGDPNLLAMLLLILLSPAAFSGALVWVLFKKKETKDAPS